MSRFSVPNGVMVSEEADFKPGPETVAEFEGCSRDFLLWTIEDMRAIAVETDATLSDTFAFMRAIGAAHDSFSAAIAAMHPPIVLTQAELDERIATALPKKRRKAGGS